jgi:hypothetical protein
MSLRGAQSIGGAEHGQRIACARGAGKDIGHLLDTLPVISANSLKSLARPTGIEPVFPP